MASDTAEPAEPQPPKHPFPASRAKIDRARKHLRELEAEAAQYVASEPFKASAEITQEETFHTVVFHMQITKPVPACIGPIIGDVIHNLRAALDLAACETVRAAGQDDTDVYFPFCKQPADLDEMIKRRNFHRAGPDAVSLIKQLQPYHGGNVALRAIHDLDIEDKHRALIPGVMSGAGPVVSTRDDDGTPNFSIVGDPNAPSEVTLVFPEGTALDRKDLIPTLHDLVKLADSIVESLFALANR